jgi:hypothetical protein
MPTFVLVHSPLVGPFTWSLVADELGTRGVSAALPTLPEDQRAPYWRRHAEAVAAQVADAGGPLVLVGHSGACPLLPAIGTAIDGTISAYVLVDGDLPLAPGTGGSRVDLLRAASPALADELEALLAAGGSFPTWGDEDLLEEIPDHTIACEICGGGPPAAAPVLDGGAAGCPGLARRAVWLPRAHSPLRGGLRSRAGAGLGISPPARRALRDACAARWQWRKRSSSWPASARSVAEVSRR